MKKILLTIRENRYFVLFILLFAYIHSIYTRISVRQEVNAYIFTPEAALGSLLSAGVLYIVMLFFIRKNQKNTAFSTIVILKIFSLSLLVYILIMLLSGFFIASVFNTVEKNFNQSTFSLSLLSDFLDGFIYGSFFLAYYYYHINQKHQQELARYNQMLAESKIKQLKTQLNPHFLFNNLNILDQLIEENKQKASDFLNEFADTYRYVLKASDRKLIPIREELEFALHYFKLIQYKYGDAYQLTIKNNNTEGFIVPMTLQLLIENAVQHNLGTVHNPICITLTISENIVITNNVNLKRNAKLTSGRALSNLKEQYHLLTGQPMKIEEGNNAFAVTIPIIQTQEK